LQLTVTPAWPGRLPVEPIGEKPSTPDAKAHGGELRRASRGPSMINAVKLSAIIQQPKTSPITVRVPVAICPGSPCFQTGQGAGDSQAKVFVPMSRPHQVQM
jgi:hypothetical protein